MNQLKDDLLQAVSNIDKISFEERNEYCNQIELCDTFDLLNELADELRCRYGIDN